MISRKVSLLTEEHSIVQGHTRFRDVEMLRLLCGLVVRLRMDRGS